jgi:hypothetical protein
MRTRALLALLVAFTVLPVAQPAGAGGGVTFITDAKRYEQGTIVTITMTNEGMSPATMGSEWHIQNLDTDSGWGNYLWTDDEITLAPGESRTWNWEQHGRCDGACQNVWEGELADAGRYSAVAEVNGMEMTANFTIGVYFTLGFDCCPQDDFTVFVARQDDVDQMREEASAKDKTLIVSSVVRVGRKGYNSDWNYSMDPRSIELGEIFIEVCDAAPRYVERHRRQWKGDVWCPWSSYVAREGR